jgi:hypothetical protein
MQGKDKTIKIKDKDENAEHIAAAARDRLQLSRL